MQYQIPIRRRVGELGCHGVISALALFACLALHSAAQAQADNDVRLSALPYYNYGRGLGITSPDSLFQLNIRFRMQNRAAYIDEAGKDAAYEAAVRRLRLRFDGYVGDPRFLYVIQLSFAPGDVGALEEGENLNVIRDAIVFYRPVKHWEIGFGQTKLPGNRQRVNSSGALQLTDRTINNARFNVDRDFGLQVHYLNELANRFSYNIKTAISTGEGRNWTRDPDDGLAYTCKLELFPLGAFAGNGTIFEGDIKREPRPKLMCSAAYHFNHKGRRTQGTLGSELFERRDMAVLLLDAMFKYRGWSAQAAYMSRQASDPVTVSPEDPAALAPVFVGDGYDMQLSYLFASNYEAIGRFSAQAPHADIASLAPKARQFTVGLTRYIWEHALKLQTEVTSDVILPSTGGVRRDWYVRFQIELGI